MKLLYPAIFSPDDNSGYTVVFPDLPGCITEGDSLEEAYSMAVDASCGWILDELEEGNKPPKASNVSDIKLQSEDFVCLVSLDIDRYAELYGSQAIRKNTTIPAWLATLADKNHINYSKVLQAALQQQLLA